MPVAIGLGNSPIFVSFAGSVPLAPTNLTAVQNGVDVDLAWTDNATNEDGYKVYRSSDGVSYVEIDDIAADSTSYTDTTITGGVTYWYYVAAYNGDGESASNIVTFNTLLTNLTAYWTLDESSGNRVDSVSGLVLVDNASVGSTAGKQSLAADFSGTNYLQAVDNPAFSFGNEDFSIAFWVRVTTVGSTQWIIAKGDTTGLGAEYWVAATNVNTLRFSLMGLTTLLDSVVISSGVWYFCVAWYDATADRMRIQLNNGTILSSPINTTGSNDGSGALAMGATNGAIFNLTGVVDEVGFWRRVLTSDEKTTLYNGGSGVTYPFDLASYDLVVSAPLAYGVFQRDGSDQADIAISGTYIGTPSAIEASFNGGAYATIDAAPSGGTFSGTLLAQSAGQGDLIVRFVDDISVSATINYVGVGDVFLVSGQSNAEGHLTNPQSYSHGSLKAVMFREDGAWAELSDPSDSDLATGSVWPLLATLHMAAEGVPIGFITTADGASGLVTPANWASAGAQYNNCVATVVASGVNDIAAILWFQGELDSRNGVTQANYQTALSAMLDSLQSDLSTTAPLICGQIGYDGLAPTNKNAIRLAQQNRWINDADIYVGPLTYDIDISSHDIIHFETDAEGLLLAQRWWRCIDAALFAGAESGRGPQFSTATRSGTTVTVTFAGGEGNLTGQTDTTGWRFTDDGTPITINSAAANGTNAVDLTLTSTPTGTELISFGSDNDGAGATLNDSGTYPLPPEPFIDEVVT